MKSTVKLPRVAETVDEVIVSEWLVDVGDSVAAGQVLLRVETDKAVVDVPAPISGTVIALLAKVDEEISTGHPIAILEQGS
jgi:pyruvate/2-oxoglutarate dehydrogenase complex dihydrolipoamide acyltransferase (E2) component